MLIFFLVGTAYFGYFMSREQENGQSLGKQWLGIRVVREDGQPIGALFAGWREIGLIGILFGALFGSLSLGLIPLINYLWPLWDKKDQALHDKIARTRVIYVS